MAEIKPLIKLSDLKTNRLRNAASNGAKRAHYDFDYDDVVDAAMIVLIEPKEGVIVYDIDSHVGYLVEENSLEIVGLRIDAFEKSFVPTSESLKRIWDELNSSAPNIPTLREFALPVERNNPKLVKAILKAAQPVLGSKGAVMSDVAA